jgi:L-asparaginase
MAGATPDTLEPMLHPALESEQKTIGPVIIKAASVSAAAPNARSAHRKIAILNTGGTIGMKANSSGALAPCPGYLEERIVKMDEFSRAEMPAVDLFELLPLLDSSDMGPSDWVRIASTIEEHYNEYDGFVVVMGTDTMAYCASSLSFLFENLSKTVVLTGAMLPLVDLFNDAQRNLIVSVVLAATLDLPEVCVFINDKLLRGNRTVKVNSSGLDAFDSPNFSPLANLEVGIRFRPYLCLPQPAGEFRVHKSMCTNIAVWRMIPGFDDEYIVNSILHAKGLRAVVLELYGTGNVSGRRSSFVDALSSAISKGIIIVAASQCMRGTVNLSAYALGKKLEAIGVIPGLDMTTETITAKLAFLLSWPDVTTERVIEYMHRNLRGELTEEAHTTLSSPLPGEGHREIPSGGSGDVRITMDSLQGTSQGTVPLLRAFSSKKLATHATGTQISARNVFATDTRPPASA